MRRVVVIFGPPGAGKTTLAKTLGLAVYDRDDPCWRNEAHFSSALSKLGRDPNAQAAVIRSGATRNSRSRTLTMTHATECHILEVDAETCIRRIKQRNHNPRNEMAAVRRWWETYTRQPGKVDRHHNPEYLAARKRAAELVSSGDAYCSEPRCLHEERGLTRWIPPDTPSNMWHLSHDKTGSVLLGPSHRRCNLSEAAVRGNTRRMVGATPTRWVIP